MNMTIGTNCVKLIKKFEGLRLKSYQDTGGVWTIGYGHTGTLNGKVLCKNMRITKDEALSLLKDDLNKYVKNVNGFSSYNWTQNEFDALVCFAYNIGSINSLTNNGMRTRQVISNKILEYNKDNGKILNGLTKRRKAEYALFLKK